MNKQELYDKINQLPSVLGWQGHGAKVMIAKDSVLDLIDQLDEPQKVVVPQFVAEWLERNRDCRLDELYHRAKASLNVYNWVFPKNNGIDNTSLLARAWLDGYEVEREKLYTVEILGASLFKAISDNHVRFKMVDNKFHITSASSPYTYISKLTEKEIKSVDERLWQFAKEV